MPTGSYFELQSDGGTIPLRLEGEYNADGTVESLTVGDVPEPTPLIPAPPTVTSLPEMDSRTQYTLTWLAPDNSGRPPITGYKVFRSADGGAYAQVGATLSAATFTKVDSGLSTNTPEIIFRYYVKAVNSNGDGEASNVVAVQWNGTPTPQPPLAPFGLNFGSVTQTGATLTWSVVSDGSVTKQGVFRNGVLFRDNLAPNAIVYNLASLVANTAYNNMTVRRWNAEGWSPHSNAVSFTTLGSGSVVHDPVMGVSNSDEPHKYSDWEATRAYTLAASSSNSTPGAVAALTDFPNCRVIGVTDDGGYSRTSLAYVDAIETMLESFYYGTGSSARQNVELHIANGNEVDREYTTGSLPQAFIDVYAAMRDLIHTTTGGTRRYPNASVWVDMTANNVKTSGAGPRFKPIARYLDGFAASFYPAGRTIATDGELLEYWPYPAGSIWTGRNRNDYSFYVDPLFAALADWRATGSASGGSLVGQLDELACWEVGIPIHHSLRGLNLANAVRATTDITQRPRYLTGGAKTSGAAGTQYDFKGLLNYIYDKCVAEQVSMREMLYWDQQSNIDIPNPLRHDTGKTSPDTADAWRNWTPGTRLPNA